jgi:hypothetical protein
VDDDLPDLAVLSEVLWFPQSILRAHRRGQTNYIHKVSLHDPEIVQVPAINRLRVLAAASNSRFADSACSDSGLACGPSLRRRLEVNFLSLFFRFLLLGVPNDPVTVIVCVRGGDDDGDDYKNRVRSAAIRGTKKREKKTVSSVDRVRR